MRLALVALGSLVLLAAVAVAAAQYHRHRRLRGCEEELAGALNSRKTYESFLADPRPDGLHRRFRSEEVAELQTLASGWGQNQPEIGSKATQATTTGVFLFGDMVYFLFFDAAGKLQDYVCVAN